MGIRNAMKNASCATRRAATLLLAATLLGACAPEVGSDAWCTAMTEKPKGDWSANEAADFARHCVFRRDGND